MGMEAGMGAMGAAGGAGAAGIVTILKYIAITLGGGILLGAFVGLVFAGIKYPNPNKKALFTPIQKIIAIVLAIAGIAMIVYAFTKKPGGDVMVDADASMSGQVLDENGVLIDKPDGETQSSGESAASGEEASDSESATESDASASGEGGDASSASDSSSGESSASSSEASTATADAPAASAAPKSAPKRAPGATMRGGGAGRAIMIG